MKRFFLILVVFCLFGFASAVECGNVPTNGCVITNNTVFDVGIYNLASGISIGANDLTLDCNGAILVGGGVGNGIYNSKFDRVEVRNCNIKNYSNGIYFHFTYTTGSYATTAYTPDSNILSNNILEDNDVGFMIYGFSYPYQSKNHNISNNIFRDNNKGIDFRRTISSNISSNIFERNLEGVDLRNEIREIYIFQNSFFANLNYGVSMGDGWNGLVYGNMFNETGIVYVVTNGNEYCSEDGTINEYNNGAYGPPCDCLPLVDGLRVTSSEDFCDETYSLPLGIVVDAHNVVLNCNGATLVGEGFGNGIYNSHFDNVEIRNCSIKNYINGIYLHSLYTHWGYAPNYNVLMYNVLENNTVGLKSFGRDYSGYPSIDPYSSEHDISYNIFRGNNKGMNFRYTVDSNVSYNVFEDNSEEGFNLLDEVWGNRIFGNHFLLNNVSAYSLEVNSWNNSEEGNYWDDYDEEEQGCYDLDGDFICDDPYDINGSLENRDYLPMLEESCSGKLNVFVEDSFGNTIDNVFVYLNGGNESVIDIDGFVEFDVDGDCGVMQEVQVRCSDKIKICDEKSSLLSYSGDVDSMGFVCDVCSGGKDLFVLEDELVFRNQGVDVLVHSVGINSDVEVALIKSCGGVKELVGEEKISVSAGEVREVRFVEDFDGCEMIDINVQYFEDEDYFDNNFIRDYFVVEPVKVYLDVDVGFEYVDVVIENYLGEYVQLVSRAEADLEIYVGKNLYRTASVGVNYLEKGLIRFDGKREGLPWNGLIQQGAGGVGNRLYVFGNEIDGTIAAVKRLVGRRENYLNGRMLGKGMIEVYLEGSDVGAVGVFDYLHTEENVGDYKKNNYGFARAVNSVLRDLTFNLEVKRVVTSENNVSLRLKHLGSEYSSGFRSLVGTRPVVMAGGLFSDLTMWEGGGDGLAVDLAESGKDVWEIEMTGGPGTECDGCLDYTYEDLVDSYWPALIAGVQYYSGKVSVDYVGHSNGCRVALSSLAKYQDTGLEDVGSVDGVMVDLSPRDDSGEPDGGGIVERFVGVGCPAELNDGTFLSAVARKLIEPEFSPSFKVGFKAMEYMEDKTHIIIKDYIKGISVAYSMDGAYDGDGIINLAHSLGGLAGKEKISNNLMGYYNDLATDELSYFDLSGLDIEKLRLYYGNAVGSGHDGLVPIEDMSVILDQKNGQDWSGEVYKTDIMDGKLSNHVSIKNRAEVKKSILEELI